MSEWHTETLGQLVDAAGGVIRTGPFGSQLHRHEYVDDGEVAVVMPKDMIDGRIASNSIARIGRDTAARLGEHLLRPADIVLARRGDIGRAAWVHPKDGAVLCGTGSMRIHLPDGKVAPRYLHYFLQAGAAAEWLQGQAVGATMPNLNADIVRGLPVRYPIPKTQSKIVEILDSIDELIENNRRRIALLAQMAQAIYGEWFVQFHYPSHGDNHVVDSPLGPIPSGWEWTTLGASATSYSGGTPSTKVPEYWGGGIPWITGGSLTSVLLDRSERTLTEEGVRAGSRMVPRDALMCVVRGMSLVKEFRVGIADRPLAFGQDCKAFVATQDVEPVFLAFSIITRASDIQAMVELAGHGTGKLSSDRLEAVVFPLPPREVQRRFVGVVADMREMIGVLRASVDALASIRDGLLPRLVTGAIDVSLLNLDALLEESAS